MKYTYDPQIQNATVANSWPFDFAQDKLVVNSSNLSTLEKLLGLIPLGILLPKLIEKLRKRHRDRVTKSIE